MWMRKDFEDAALKVSTDYTASGGSVSINDLVTKVAQDAKLTPDGIRTLIGSANVAVFENRFAKSASDKDGDRIDASEFVVGDAESVIQNIYNNAKEAHDSNVTTSEYNQQVDLFGDLSSPTEKTAGYESEDEEEDMHGEDGGFSKKEDKDEDKDKKKGKSKDDFGHYSGEEDEDEGEKKEAMSSADVRHLFKRAEDRMQEAATRAKVRWENLTKEAANTLVAQDSRVSNRTVFEKNAVAMLGDCVVPELTQISYLTSKKDTHTNLFGGEKVASIISKHIVYNNQQQQPIIELVKEAMQARTEYVKNKSGLQWIKENESIIK